ncbi:MAG TPA: DedA family protein, partial [Solirubrobacteraceae bacterium]|nr:DedA family protein [Solirubrobacteraceae bacterium]
MTALITSYGPLGVFLLMVPESACIPIPSEVTLLSSGLAVSQHWMSLPLAILAATAGNVIGSLIAYALGATQWLTRAPGVRRSAALLDRHGLKAIFIARLLPLARTFVSLPAGARRTPMLPFIVLTTLGSAIWALAFVLLGMLPGTASSSLLGKITL